MITFRLLSTSLLFVLVFGACNPERVKYTSELKQQMADMKIKRITNADMVGTVDKFGERISNAVQRELAAALQKNTDPAQRTKFCQLQLPRIQAIAERYRVDIRLVGAADVKSKSLSQKEREVLDAYLYNAEQKLPQISNIQKINDELFIYNAAVPTDNIICKSCFGDQKIPLAVWRLAFSKREVVRRITPAKK